MQPFERSVKMPNGRVRVMLSLALALATLWTAAPAREAVKMASPEDRQILAAFLKHTTNIEKQLTPAAMAKIETAEDICWVWCPYLQMPLTAYELTGDTKYLDTYVKAVDVLLTRLRTGPDGFKGFRGLPEADFRDAANPSAQCDVNITEFSVTENLCDFVELVNGEPALKEKYGPKAAQYLALAVEHLAGPKWEKRGDYVDLGRQGAIFRMAAANGPQRRLLTDPNNKQSKMCRAYLALYRVTGQDEFFKKAVKLGVRYKHTLKLEGDCYHWNYWEPAGDWDRKPGDPGQWRHWIGPEHRDGYHGLTLAMVAALYDHGVVMNKTDLARFLKTQTTINWNGSLEHPVFKNTRGEDVKEKNMSTFLAPALAPFDSRIREYLYGPRATQERLARLNSDWQGGVVAVDYLQGKYLRPQAPEPQMAKYREQFSRKPENAAFLKDLEFEIPATGK